MFNLKKLFNMKRETEIIEVVKYYGEFKTTDGETHNTHEYKWTTREKDYLTTRVQYEGYINDQEDNVYFIENIISLKWCEIQRKKVECYTEEVRFHGISPSVYNFFSNEGLEEAMVKENI